MEFIIIGYGSAGQRHRRYLSAAGQTIAAIADMRLRSKMKRTPRVYQNADECLRQEADGRAVIVATPHMLHAHQSLLAIDSGCRALLVEKPLAMTAYDARQIATGAETMGVQGAVACNYRFHDAVISAKRAIFGVSALTIMGCEDVTQWPKRSQKWLADPSYRGVLYASTIHLIDIAIHILGQPTSAGSMVQKTPRHWADQGATLRIQHGESLSLISSEWTRSDRDYFILSSFGPKHVVFRDLKNYPIGDMYQRMTAAMIKLAGDAEQGDLTTLEQGWQNVNIMEAAWNQAST